VLGAQTVPPAEVVVVDNDCADGSVDVARRYGARVVVEPRPGIPAAAAAGYDAAVADVIARCDADTVPPADWVERITRAMSADPQLDALTGGGRFYGLPRWLAPLAGRLYLGAYYVLVHAALGHTPVWGSNMAVRTSTWSEVRHLVHLDAELHDDIDLAFALGPCRRVRYERRLSVGVSARSLRGPDQLRRRLRRALRTMEVNWRVVPPWLRWRSRILAEPLRERDG
jgi:glycosyltransferase involved in cell wall biosynthesis